MPRWAIFDEPALAKGFTSVPNVVFSLPLGSGAKLLYIVYLRFAWQDPLTYPNNATLCEAVSCTLNTLRAYRRELISINLISVVERQGQSSTVRFHMLSPLMTLPESEPLPNIEPLPKPEPPGVQTLTPPLPETDPDKDSPTITHPKTQEDHCASAHTSAIKAYHDLYSARVGRPPKGIGRAAKLLQKRVQETADAPGLVEEVITAAFNGSFWAFRDEFPTLAQILGDTHWDALVAHAKGVTPPRKTTNGRPPSSNLVTGEQTRNAAASWKRPPT